MDDQQARDLFRIRMFNPKNTLLIVCIALSLIVHVAVAIAFMSVPQEPAGIDTDARVDRQMKMIERLTTTEPRTAKNGFASLSENMRSTEEPRQSQRYFPSSKTDQVTGSRPPRSVTRQKGNGRFNPTGYGQYWTNPTMNETLDIEHQIDRYTDVPVFANQGSDLRDKHPGNLVDVSCLRIKEDSIPEYFATDSHTFLREQLQIYQTGLRGGGLIRDRQVFGECRVLKPVSIELNALSSKNIRDQDETSERIRRRISDVYYSPGFDQCIVQTVTR